MAGLNSGTFGRDAADAARSIRFLVASRQAEAQQRIANQQIGEERRQFDRLFGQRQSVLNSVLPFLQGFGGVFTGGSGGGLSQPVIRDGAAGGQGGFVGGLLDQLEGFGSGERARINQDFTDLSGTASARLEARGLGGSSLLPSVLSGVERERQLALGELGDRVIGQRIGVQERGADRAIDFVGALSSLLGGL